MFEKIDLLRSIHRLSIMIGTAMLISGCIIQVPAQSNGSQNYAKLPPEQIAAYNEMANSNTKGERSIANDGIPLPQQIAQIEAFLNNPEAFAGDSGDTELTRQIDAQMKLKKLQTDLEDMDNLTDIDL
ncbi:hypothetical protein [Thorsellia anophelis]|uniref:Uncharacterized protein n=1 Tax=Thorsellia anophelis DSM 18579 TaxID=1123402 RepID=A0A1I0F5U8_9GAMM|nr:hypothetical protein [Thorsellia anophelis]SET52801.1 hypothetical protein SAMN02583745_02641 [Thorsellia anophelis DSM 18579]